MDVAREQTPNVGLNKWAPYDYLRRAEFNQNWDTIDRELGKKSNQTDLTNLSQIVSANHTAVTQQLEELSGSVVDVVDVTGLATTAELANLETTVSEHQAKIASPTKLGHVKIGNNLSIDGNGVLSALSGDTSILQREILRIKMRQTGLNLDPNAWSDTIEDASGINNVLSSQYVFDSANKSLKASLNYDVKYEGDVLPQNATPAWTKATTGTVTESVAGGILTLGTTAVSSDITYKLNVGSILPNKTKYIKFRMKTNVGADTPFQVFINDGTKRLLLRFSYGSTGWTVTYNSSGWQNFGQVDTTIYHEYIISMNNIDGAKIYVDGTLLGSIPYGSLGAVTDNFIAFGSNSGAVTTNNQASLDYWYHTIDYDQSLSSTVKWNPVTSEGTFTKAVIEALANLGTGSITYEISRDGGTTFTPCAIDTVTDISSQPNGTSIVLKATITGNAELLAVAWGGSV